MSTGKEKCIRCGVFDVIHGDSVCQLCRRVMDTAAQMLNPIPWTKRSGIAPKVVTDTIVFPETLLDFIHGCLDSELICHLESDVVSIEAMIEHIKTEYDHLISQEKTKVYIDEIRQLLEDAAQELTDMYTKMSELSTNISSFLKREQNLIH